MGETVRIFFGVGGPNFTSSFHVIGGIFDHVYEGASLGAVPLTGVQTVSVPPGGATVVDFKLQRAARYTLVDHALSRLERGLVGFLIVDGPRDDDLMHEGPAKR
jgi:nitrite reductase (NO-forming)